MNEDAVLSFVRAAIKSAWSVELLLLIRRASPKAWTGKALVRDLRASPAVVAESLAALQSCGVIAVTDAGEYLYAPQTPELEQLVDGLAELYATKPLTVLQTIFALPTDRIRSFSDAFLFKK